MKKYLSLLIGICYATYSLATVDCTTLAFVHSNETTITISLPTSPNCDVATYEIQHRVYGSSDPYTNSSYNPYDLNGPRAFVFSLEPCTEYEFFVKVFCDGELEGGCVSSFEPFTTTGCPGLDCSQIEVVNITETTARVNLFGFEDCRGGLGNFLTYKFHYKPVKGTTWLNTGGSIGSLNSWYMLYDLEPCLEYEFRVSFFCDGEYTDWCTGTFTTDGCPDPDGCSEVVPYDITDSTVKFTFTDFEDCRDADGGLRYDIHYKDSDGIWHGLGNYTNEDFLYLEGLEACTIYEYKIRFMCDGEYTDFCTGTFVTTDCVGCDGIYLFDISERHAQITLFGYEDCRLPDGFLHFEFNYRPVGIGSLWITYSVATRGNTHYINGLNACTEYEYRIRFLCDGEYTDWCVGIFTTLECEGELPGESGERAAFPEVLSFDKNKNTLKVYPNPTAAGTTLTILDTTNQSITSVKLFTLSGQLSYQNELMDGESLLLPADLAPGVYVLMVSGPDFSKHSLLMVQ